MTQKLISWDLPSRLGRLPSLIETTGRGEAQRLKDLVVRHAPRRTGALARSWRVKAIDSKEYQVVSTHPGAIFISTGGTLKPVSARYLSIPNRGRGGAGSVFVSSGRLVAIPTARGNLVVVDRERASRRIRATYARQATQMGTKYLERALNQFRPDTAQRVLRGISEAFIRRGGG